MPQVVEPDSLEPHAGCEPLEPAGERVWVQVRAVSSVHHEALVAPGRAEEQPARGLILPVPAQMLDDRTRKRDGPTAPVGLRRDDPELFFQKKGGTYAEARQICAGCPVMADCREY
jgi:co-chaperonin GroES (HSP10)